MSMVPFLPRLFAAALVLLAFADAASGHEGLLPAPYQVDGVIRFKSDRYRLDTGLGLNPPLIAVDLGATEGKAHPDRKRLGTMTIVGTAGIGTAKLVDIRKTCDFLCGEGGEECHYVGLFALDGAAGSALDAIGTPLAAIPGVHAPAGFRAVTPETGTAFPRALIGRDFAPLAWAPYGKDGPEARITGWDSATGRLGMDLRWRAGDTFSGDGQDCMARRIDDLTAVSCNPVAVILATEGPLLLSYPDYNLAAAEVVARIGLGKTTVCLVRLGLKAQTAFGLLYRDKDGWRGLFRPRDYALLC